jgi:hypothetical protein
MQKLSEKLYLAKKEWSKLDRIASELEETKKTILGCIIQIFIQQDHKLSIAKAEWLAYASSEYVKHIKEMTNARMEANMKYAEVQGIIEAIKEIERANIKNSMELKYNNKNGYGGNEF